MEIGFLGLDGIQGSVCEYGEASKQKWASSRNEGLGQERFGLCGDDFRVSKMAKTNADFSPDSNSLMLENSGGFVEKSTFDADKLRFFCHSMPENSAFPYLHHMASAHTKNAGSLNASSGMYLESGVRGPFTQSQWLELEQQALIYKYMKENEPIPLQLLIPIVKAFESAGLLAFNGGMGPFHLGYATSTDPEPGRCRRTDGKKWRCSRDAVTTQKYCERHMNRGRHRSRKHVEGQANGNGIANGNSSSTTTKHNNFDLNNQNQYQYQMNAFADNNNNKRMVVDGEKSGQGMQQVNWSGEMGMNGFGVPCQLSSLSPMCAADFMSSSTDLNMGLGVGSNVGAHKQAKWSSISYGPLGEALQSSTEEK
ncbi:hypothetical protein V2J09_017053 [Rumex salicifolius]